MDEKNGTNGLWTSKPLEDTLNWWPKVSQAQAPGLSFAWKSMGLRGGLQDGEVGEVLVVQVPWAEDCSCFPPRGGKFGQSPRFAAW